MQTNFTIRYELPNDCSSLWKFDPESASFAWLGFDTNAAAHFFYSSLHDGQANARSGIFVGMQALKRSEDSLLMLWCNANSVVLNPEAHITIVWFGINVHFGRPFRRNEFDRIVDEIV